MNDDQELIRKTLRGNHKAFEMIIQRYEQPILNFVGRMVQDRELAMDFSQEVFLKAYTSLDSYRPEYKFSTWLFKIASNCVIDYWRKKKIPTLSLDQPSERSEESLTIQIPDDCPSVGRRFELQELRERIEAALTKLPASFRELFVWRHVTGLSYEEIADIKGIPLGTVKNRVFQAKEMLRKLLEEEPWPA
jgi:RNA polymerase sigma-70 factor (ECF subfamily)